MSHPLAITLTLRLGRALHRYGTPSHRLEDTLVAVAAHLGETAQIFSTPTAMFASFGPGEGQQTSLLRMEPGDVDLGKLTRVDAVVGEVLRDEVDPETAIARLVAIEAAPVRYAAWMRVGAYAIASAAAARFLGGGIREIVVALGAGFLTGLVAAASDRVPTLRRVFVPLAAFLVAASAMSASAVWPPLSAYVATLGGLIVLIPGLSLTVSMSELANGHLASGTARSTSAAMVFLLLAFGVAAGTRLGALVPGATSFAAPEPLATWTELVSLVVSPLTFVVLFRALPAQLPVILLASWAGYGAARAGAAWSGPELGVFLGALTLGMAGNLYRRWIDRPATVPIVPGLLLLVPGSVGFRSLSSLMADDVLSGVQAAFTMAMTAVALVAGLLLANALVPTRSKL